MKTIGIFYGSTNGTTANIANRIANILGINSADINDVSVSDVEKVTSYEVLLLGSSTWNGGNLQDDWVNFLPSLKQRDLSGKYVAIFGTGDAYSYRDSFCNAIGTIYRELIDTDCMFCGAVSTEGYNFDRSIAQISDMFVGLPLDEVNEEYLTENRIKEWIEQITIECLN